ncbi:MAG: triphosphoribosyl-dephospho-CoA synthase [Nitrososphaerales archaeon]
MGKGRVKGVADIALCGTLASMLEVAGWPKPGNVHRTSSFEPKFERFLCGAAILYTPLLKAAEAGFLAASEVKISGWKFGELLTLSYTLGLDWHREGNTNLGTAMLLLPLSAGAGLLLGSEGKLDFKGLRRATETMLQATDVNDALIFYKLLRKIGKRWLGRVKGGVIDVLDPRAYVKIRRLGCTFLDLMKMSAEWDSVAYELAHSMPITFELTYPTMVKYYRESGNINVATVNTFLTILAQKSDTFIVRKLKAVGVDGAEEEAKRVSEMAREALKLGGVATEVGRERLFKMDEELKRKGGLLNPGSTADLVAAGLMLLLLSGVKI